MRMKFINYTFLFALLFIVPLSITAQQSPPNEAISHLNEAIDLYQARKFDQAILLYSKAIAAFPQYHKAYAYRAQAHVAVDELDNAIGDLENAIRIDPSQTKLYTLMASIYGQQ